MHLLPAIIWMVLIFTLSAQAWIFGRGGDPASAGDTTDTSWINWSTRFEWSWSPLSLLGRAAHLTEYAVLAALLYWGLVRLTRYHERAAWLALALVVAYGVSDEVHQSFVPGRTPSLADLMLDLLGAAFALLVVDARVTRRFIRYLED